MIESDVQRLNPGTLIDLFELDPTSLGGDVLRWHAGVNRLGNDVVWQGRTYTRMPVEASGFSRSGQGTMPRPQLRVGNVGGLLGALVRELNDLVGARVTRRRTFSQYLDAINFAGGNPLADPNVSLPDEVWTIDRKSAENRESIEFELAAAFDVQGAQLPGRACIQNVCPASTKYRRWDPVTGAFDYTGTQDCGYTGVLMFTRTGQPTSDPAQDVCSKRLGDGCKARFGAYAELPFGGFPGVGLIR